MGNQTDIYAALVNVSSDIADLIEMDVAFLDDEFEATIDPDNTFEPYIEFKLFKNSPAWQGLNSGRMDQGLLQLDVVWPRGKDRAGAVAAIDEIISLYPKGSYLDGMLKVQKAPWAASPLVEDDRTRHPITIPWTI